MKCYTERFSGSVKTAGHTKVVSRHDKNMKNIIATLFVGLSVFSVQAAKAQEMWKLIWYDHFRPNQLFEVVGTDVSKADVDNRIFNSWCVPFDPNKFVILQPPIQIAGDEHWKGTGASEFLSEHGLPMLNERWFQIMDDERWYIYRVRPR
jgi:hypothetical protein